MRDYIDLKTAFDQLDAEVSPLIMKGKTQAELIKIDESFKVLTKQTTKLKNYIQNRSVINKGNTYPSYPFY